MGDVTLYTVLPTNTQAAGIALTSVGVMLSANRAIRLLLNSPTGMLYDRLPRRPIYVSALFIGALSTALYAWNGGFWLLLAGRLLWGLAWSGIWVGGTTIMLDVTNDLNRGRWLGMYQLWSFLGIGLGSFAGGVLTDWLGYHTSLVICATGGALGALAALALLPETRPHRFQPDHSSEPTNSPRLTRLTAEWKSLAANKGFLVATIIHGINRFITAGVIMATLALLVEQNLSGWNIALGVGTLTGALMLGRNLVSMVAAPLSGTFSDARGDRWIVTMVMALVGCGGIFLSIGINPMVMLAGILLVAFASSGIQTTTTALAGDLVDIRLRGQSIGWLNTSGDLGSAVGPLLAYALIPLVGLINVYLFCTGIFLLCAVLAYLARDFQPPKLM